MATKELLAQLKLRKDTAASWTEKNPVIGNGEMIIVETSSGEQRFKIGDGEKTFTQLPYTDETLLSKIKTYSAGDGITISNEGIISSDSDVFVVELDPGFSTVYSSYDDIKSAIENKKTLVGCFDFVGADRGGSDPQSVSMTCCFPMVGAYFGSQSIVLILRLWQTEYMYSAEKEEGSTEEPTWAVDEVSIPYFSSSALSNSGVVYRNSTNGSWEIKDVNNVYILNMVSNSNANTMKITNDFDAAKTAYDNGKILRVEDTDEETNEITYYDVIGFSSETNSSTNKTTATIYAREFFSLIYSWEWDKDTQNVTYIGATDANQLGDTYIQPVLPVSNVLAYLYSAPNYSIKHPHLVFDPEAETMMSLDIICLPIDTTKTTSMNSIYFTEDITDSLTKACYGGWDLQILNADWTSGQLLQDWKINNIGSNKFLITCRYLLSYGEEVQFTYDSTDTEHKMVYVGKKGSSSSAEEFCAEVTLGEKDTSKSIGEWVLVYPGTVANSVTYDQALTAFNSNTPVKIRVTSTKTISGVSIPIISEAYMTRYIAAQNALIFDYVHNATDLSVSSGGLVWTSDETITCYTATYSFAFGSTDTSATSVQVPTTTKVQDMIAAAVSNIDTSGNGGYTIQVSNAAPATGTSNKIITYVVEDA